jgi:DNA-binding XRE family transcriptional regulator
VTSLVVASMADDSDSLAPGSIGDVLQSSRERVGLSREAAAEAVRINRLLLNHYEAGRRQVPLALAVELAGLYRTPVEALSCRARGWKTQLSTSARCSLGRFPVT